MQSKVLLISGQDNLIVQAGRVGLHSLPRAEKFYDNQGMLDLGKDNDYEDLIYFEYEVWRSRR